MEEAQVRHFHRLRMFGLSGFVNCQDEVRLGQWTLRTVMCACFLRFYILNVFVFLGLLTFLVFYLGGIF